MISPSNTAFLAKNLAVASSKFFYAAFLKANNLASYAKALLTSAFFKANLTYNSAIYLANNSFLLSNLLDSSYKWDLVAMNASLASASAAISAFLPDTSFANKSLKILVNYPLTLANDLTVS